MAERTVGLHEFWLQTCGLDSHRRGQNYARLDTPWNAFTANGSKLVCTLWVDLIVDVHDPELERARRFVKMGGRSRRWKGVDMQHGQQARANLDKAIAETLPIFGFEAEPNMAALERGERAVKHFYLDRCVFRTNVTARFGIVTADFGSVTGRSGDVTAGVLAPA